MIHPRSSTNYKPPTYILQGNIPVPDVGPSSLRYRRWPQQMKTLRASFIPVIDHLRPQARVLIVISPDDDHRVRLKTTRLPPGRTLRGMPTVKT
jgi:hypothetical protein